MIIRPVSNQSEAMIDLTPVIDMVFLLLIFFLVATTFQQSERQMNIALPVASAATPISAALRELVINVNENGQCFVAGKESSDTELRTIISAAVKNNSQQKVTVRGDKRAAYAHIVRVLDICKTAGIQEPYLDTVLRD